MLTFKKIYLLFFKYVYPPVYHTFGTAAPITIKQLFIQKVIGINRNAYWPVHHSSIVSGVNNIQIGIGTAPGLSPGCYIQGAGNIKLGDYTIVAPNVGIISGNHNIYDISSHTKGSVDIGKYCWLGMNSIILPNVVLGDFTIVGAGSVVTKSFNDGFCVIAGNPAKMIKKLDPDKCIRKENDFKYYGYICENKYIKNK